jgi:hypothetical protein
MRNFFKLAEGVDVIPLLNALAVHDDLWNENTLRTTHPLSPHQAVDDIWLMFNEIPDSPDAVVNDLDVIPYRAWSELPHARSIIFDVMRRVEATRLGRAMITRLSPGGEIPEHVDEGAPATYYTRYMLALQSLPGALFESGGEVIQFRPGEIWMVNNRAPHRVVNNSADDRIVLIMDLRIC